MRRRQARRWTAVLVLAVAVAVLGVAALRVVDRPAPPPPPVLVELRAGGVAAVVAVEPPATVAAVLEAARLAPRDARLLSAGTGRVLDPRHVAARVLVAGLPAEREAVVPPGAPVEVVEAPDVVEAVVEVEEALPAPASPQVHWHLWRPGVDGVRRLRRGATSREEVGPELGRSEPVGPKAVAEPLVALTFDDGPAPHTAAVLDVLRDKQVPATFCVVARQLRGDGLAVVKRALAEGHRVCNHTVDHREHLDRAPASTVESQVGGGTAQLSQRLGVQPTWFRPPGGHLGPAVERAAARHGQRVLMWTVDVRDFTSPAPEQIVAGVVAGTQPGSIVLLHDGGGDRAPTVAALPVLIDRLRAAGFRFVLPDALPG